MDKRNQSWTYEEVTADGKEKRYSIRQITNGFIMRESISWYEGKGENSKWKHQENETYYETNPIDSLGSNAKKSNKAPDGAKKMAGLKELLG